MKNRKRFKLVPRFMSVMLAALFVFSGIPMSGSQVYAAEGDRAVTHWEYMDITALPENEQIVDGGYYVFSANITTDSNMTGDRKQRLLTSAGDEYNLLDMTYDDVNLTTDRVLSEYNSNVVWNNDKKFIYQVSKVNGDVHEGNQGYYIKTLNNNGTYIPGSRYLNLKQGLQTPKTRSWNEVPTFCYKYTNGYSEAYLAPMVAEPTHPYVYLSDSPRVWYWDSENKEFYTLYTMPSYAEDRFGFGYDYSLCTRAFVYGSNYSDPEILEGSDMLCKEHIKGEDGRWRLIILLMSNQYIYTTNENLGIYALEKYGSRFSEGYTRLLNDGNCKFVLQGINAGKNTDIWEHMRPATEELRDPAYLLGVKKGLSYEENDHSTAMLGAYHENMSEIFSSTHTQAARAERQPLKIYKEISRQKLTLDYNDGTGGSRNEWFYYDQTVSLSDHKPYNQTDSTFMGWSTSKHGEVINEITMTSDQTLYAQWEELNVSVGPNDEQLGSVTVSEPEGFNGKLQKGDSLKVTASPRNENVIFRGWEIGDEIVSTEAAYEIVCTTDLTITAVFECSGHKWSIKTQKATADTEGRVYKKCTVCGAEYTLATIPSAGEDDIVQGTTVLRDTANQPNAQTVYMANNAWRVIGYGGTGVAASADILTLISSDNIKNDVHFNPDSNTDKQYSGSELQSEVDAVADRFADGEKEAIATRNLASGSYIEPVDGKPRTDGIAGPPVDGALLWPLSAKEAGEMDEYLRIVDPDPSDTTRPGYWWLRSAGDPVRFASAVSSDGIIYESNYTFNSTMGLRPAFHTDLNTVLFTSAAEGGKNTGALGADALAQIGKNRSCEWKLTVKDNAHKDFAIDSARSCDGKVLYIKYSGAEAGDNEYISGVIVSSDGKVKRYGRLAVASDDDEASVKVNIDGKLDDGDSLYIFSEQYNGDFKTDFASPLQKVSIPTPGHDWDTPKYTWANDNSSVTATRSCKNDATHVETETATATFKVTKEATEDEEGEKIYTANFINGVFATQTKTVTIPKLTHTHSMVKTDKVEATCEEKGTEAYWTCGKCGKMFSDEEGANEITEVQEINATGHDWDTPEYTWSDDNSSVTAIRSCKHDATHVETETATATFEVTKEATEDKEGEKIYTANFINGVFVTQTKTVTIPKLTPVDPTTQTGEGGSAIGKGASIEAAHKAITTSNSEEGPKGSKFSPMQLKSTGQGKTNVKLTWKKPAGAVRFVVYGNACGKKNKLMKLCETKAASYNSKKINGKALKKGTYYKYMVVAVDKNNKVVSASKVVHAATKGGKVKNYTSVTTKTKKNKVSLKKGKTFKLKANAKGKNVRKHRGICYETSNAKVATVSSKGVIKAKGKGNCTVYAYAQNGVMKAIKVTVK